MTQSAKHGEVMFSRSEIEAVAAKAARGVGFDWGLAEEAGMAARRLVEAGLPGPELLLAYLEGARGSAPEIAISHWRAPLGGILCPLLTGAALCDHAAILAEAHHLRLHCLSHPALIVPFVAQVAARQKRVLRVTWTGAGVITTPGALHPVLVDALATTEAVEVTISILTTAVPATKPLQTGRRVSQDVWRRLDALAIATTVPATGSSRAGAGAGNLDND